MRLNWMMTAAVAALMASSAMADEAMDRAELEHLIKHECGSCHGLTLYGGLGPPLTPESLKHKPDEFLIAAILHGRPSTAMPPWRGIVSAAEARRIVQTLREGL